MPKISPLMILPAGLFVAFVVMAGIGMWREDPEALPSARQGQPAPELQLTAMPGKTGFTDETLRDGQVKLVNYWASWVRALPGGASNLEALADEGLPIYGINYKDDPVRAAGFLQELGDPYAGIGVDGQGRTALDWGVYGVPETYVIAGDGTILLRFAGPVTQRVITETLRPALDGSSRTLSRRGDELSTIRVQFMDELPVRRQPRVYLRDMQLSPAIDQRGCVTGNGRTS